MSQAGFEQAGIEVQQKAVFDLLRGAIERVFAPDRVEQFLQKLDRKNLSIRQFEEVLGKSVFEQLDEQLARSGKTARQLYAELSVSDQGQMRELYLTALEAVDQGLREKYAKIYRYY